MQMLTMLARIRVSGEIGGFFFYIALIGIIGGILTGVLSFIKDKLVKTDKIKKYIGTLESLIWIALFVLGGLDIFGIFPTFTLLLSWL